MFEKGERDKLKKNVTFEFRKKKKKTKGENKWHNIRLYVRKACQTLKFGQMKSLNLLLIIFERGERREG